MIKDIGKSLQKIREQQHISKKYMAHSLGVSTRTYSRLESGETPMTISRLNKLSEILDISVSKILFFQEDDNREINPIEFEDRLYSYIDYLEEEIENLKKQLQS